LTAAAADLDGPFVAPERFVGVEPTGECLDWCRAQQFSTGAQTWVPANAVFFPYLPSASASRLFSAQTTGLACGASTTEALLFALLECIERDAYSRALALASVADGDRVPVVSEEALENVIPETMATFSARGIRYLVRDLTCDTRVPTYLCTIFDGALGHYGVASRPDARCAVIAAVEEACQSRLTDIQGAREDLSERALFEGFDPWFIEKRSAEVRGIDQSSQSSDPESFLKELHRTLATLPNPTDLFWVDLSFPTVEIHVVRAIIPGLEVWAADPIRIGPGAAQWLNGEP
jgi:YcaO-like protein with predicted kinase domain